MTSALRGILWKWDKDRNELVELADFTGEKRAVDAPFVISDDIPPTESMATDQREIFTSKSKLRAHYKAHGFRETGGDHLTGKPPPRPKTRREDIINDARKALNDVRWGNAPLTELEKERCHRERMSYEDWKRRNR